MCHVERSGSAKFLRGSWKQHALDTFGVPGRGTAKEKGLKWVPVATNLDPSEPFGSMYCPYPVRTKFKLKA